MRNKNQLWFKYFLKYKNNMSVEKCAVELAHSEHRTQIYKCNPLAFQESLCPFSATKSLPFPQVNFKIMGFLLPACYIAMFTVLESDLFKSAVRLIYTVAYVVVHFHWCIVFHCKNMALYLLIYFFSKLLKDIILLCALSMSPAQPAPASPTPYSHNWPSYVLALGTSYDCSYQRAVSGMPLCWFPW